MSHLALPGDRLQRIAIEAIQLETNWQRPTPRVQRTTSLGNGTGEPYVDDMYLAPGGQLLVAAQRNRQRDGHVSAIVTFWSLEDIDNPHLGATLTEICEAVRTLFEFQCIFHR